MSTPPTEAQPDTPQTQVQVTAAKRSRVVRNVLSNWSAYIFSAVVSFFLAPYVVGHLGTVGYGVWSLLVSLTGYLSLLDLGVRGAVTRYVARFHTQGDHQRSTDIASAAMVIFSAAGILSVAASLFLARFVAGRMNIPPEYLPTAKLVLALIGVSIAISLVNGVYGGMLIALQRFDLSNGLEVGVTVLRVVAIVFALHRGLGLISLACIQVLFTLARLIANVILVRRFYPEARIRPLSANRENLRLIFSFSIFSFLLHVSGNLIYASDLVVIGAYLPVTAVTFYAIGANLVEYARAIISGISQTMTPLASSLEAGQEQRRLRELVLQSISWGTIVSIPVAITLFVRGNTFIGLWMGTEFADPSGQVLQILTVTMLFAASGMVVSSIILGISRHKPLVPVTLAEGLCNLGLSIWLVRKMGIMGVAWGTLIPSLFTNLVFLPWYVRRALGVTRSRYIISAWIKPGLAAVPFAAMSYAMEQFWPANNLVVFFLQVVLCIPCLVACDWRICLNSSQRVQYAQKFSSTFGRVFVRI